MAVLTMVPTEVWSERVARAHGILSQSLPDEVLDEVTDTDPTEPLPFELPPYLFG